MSVPIRRGSRLTNKPLSFSFDGRVYAAQVGDTAASALLANGVRLMGRSVKYRRLRGVLAAGPEEPNALLTVGSTPAVIPNVSAPQLQLRAGMILHSQNRWPSLTWDLASLLQAGGGFFGAGFYYKTFIWPSWKTYESLIRKLAGLGEAPGACEIPEANTVHASCDVLVAGAGPAGLAAALSAARAGAQVWLCEREPVAGGELEFEGADVGGATGAKWIQATLTELRERGASILTDTALIGGSSGLMIAHREVGGIAGDNTMYRIRAHALINAMGAIELPIAFVGNDRPGVMLLGAAERYLARYGVRVGNDLVLFANHDRVYASAMRLRAGGMRITAIIDTRANGELGASPEITATVTELRTSGTEILHNHTLVGAQGGKAVTGVRVAPRGSTHQWRQFACDTVLVSGGWSPATQVQQAESIVAGAANGSFDLSAALTEGYLAGIRAATTTGARRSSTTTSAAASSASTLGPKARGDCAPCLVPYWRSPANRADEKFMFVDLQNDVTVADLRAALAEGFRDIEHVKRYTTLGIGTEQGRSGGRLGAAIVAELKVEAQAPTEAPPTIELSRSRPPYHPVTMGSLVSWRNGPRLRVRRRTPLHEWHTAHGGVQESMGLWMRPRYYRSSGIDAFNAGIAESLRVRTTGGICDSSTLGKIEVAGPDAAAFLDTLYLTRASTIKPGRAKYMVNLREDGMVLDDGIVLRLAPERFLATVGSSHAEHMLAHFEHYRDIEWGGKSIALTDVTEAWGVIAVAGPASRDTLRDVLGSDWATPLSQLRHMEFIEERFQGHELKVLRASFSGELAFELHCRPAIALPLWEALVAAGLAPYGLEALDILRVEKGYLSSSEFNGQTTPFDLGMESMVKLGNACVGRELLDRPAFHETSRPRLVGLKAADGKAKFLAGAQLTATAQSSISCGHVTSTVFSPNIGEWIGLGLVSLSLATVGTELTAQDPLRDGDARVRVVSAAHFDPTGERMKSHG